ncbi:Rrf2 family transcriptional regulator [Leptospira sp. 96542]|nr:Rrf2 family transcriptional regulator [Leptospira sp. 96542]
MILGNQVEWALHCVTALASAERGKLVSSKALSEFHGVPKEYLSKCLQQLSNAGIVKTTTGPKGGYCLAKPASEISFLDVIEAVEGRRKTFQCTEIRKNNPCLSEEGKKFDRVCEIAQVMFEADESWRAVLRKRKISEIVDTLTQSIGSEVLAKSTNWLTRS